MMEPPLRSLHEVTRAVGMAISQEPKKPFAFFGHSLGALLAFEVARYCRRHGLQQSEHLFLSGCAAPQFPRSRRNLYELPDRELIEALRELNGTPEEVLENEELMEFLLPILRADFELVHRYEYIQEPKLSIPFTILTGTEDRDITKDHIEGWRMHTTFASSIRSYPGDHFFINTHRKSVIDDLNKEFRKLTGFIN